MFLNPTGISAISTARPPGERAPGVVPPLDPIGRGPRRETVAGRWCAPCEKVLGSHAGLGALGHSGEQVGHEVGAAALPTGTGKHRGDGVLQPLVSIGGYQFHPASPRAVNDRRKASQKGLAQKTLHHFSPTKAPGRHRSGRAAVAWPFIYPGRPSCGVGRAGLLGPGVCGLGGADTLNIECSLWQDCPCIVPPLVSSGSMRS